MQIPRLQGPNNKVIRGVKGVWCLELVAEDGLLSRSRVPQPIAIARAGDYPFAVRRKDDTLHWIAVIQAHGAEPGNGTPRERVAKEVDSRLLGFGLWLSCLPRRRLWDWLFSCPGRRQEKARSRADRNAEGHERGGCLAFGRKRCADDFLHQRRHTG